VGTVTSWSGPVRWPAASCCHRGSISAATAGPSRTWCAARYCSARAGSTPARAYADPSTWADPSVSPLCAAHGGLPPLLIQAGTDELLAPDAELLAASASAARVDVTYTRWPGMWHDFALQPGLLAAADSAGAGGLVRQQGDGQFLIVCADLPHAL